jgi:hypothetical protein
MIRNLFKHCKNEKEKAEDIHRRFQKLFSTEEGKICLTILLEDLYFFDTCATIETQALKNYGTYLIKNRLGVSDTFGITDAILNIKKET